jgi:acylpyruvate hydrolase
MRLVTFAVNGSTHAGIVESDQVIELPYPDVGTMLAASENWRVEVGRTGPQHDLPAVRLLPVILAPSKIFCLGLNYLRHIQEGRQPDRPPASYPTLFAKFADSLCGPADDIQLPAESDSVDWEAELVVVVGRPVRNADDVSAVNAIAGYAVGNDVSMRDWQKRSSEWLQGKAWEKATPVGPLVTSDEVTDNGRPDLRIQCALDGTIMQDGRTSEMIFDCVDCIKYISKMVTLRPGDLIFTGTPSGVGSARKPPVFISPGQVLTTTIESLGVIRNRFIAPP